MPTLQSDNAEIRQAAWIVPACLIFCAVLYVWAAPRGYDVSDDANALVWASSPFSYFYTVSEFGYLWHPVYWLVGGNIALFRLIGVLFLCVCGFALGGAMARFIGGRFSRGAGLIIAITMAAGTFWQSSITPRTPNYNTLDLGFLLVFFAALMWASARAVQPSVKAARMGDAAAAAVAGLALGVLFLSKPTTALVAGITGLAWIILLPPRHIWLCLAVAAGSLSVLLLTTLQMIFGGLVQYMTGLTVSLHQFGLRRGDNEANILVHSLVGTFLEERQRKIVSALIFGAVLAVLSGAVMLMPQRVRSWKSAWQPALGLAAAFGMGVVCVWWRITEFQGLATDPGYHLWRFAIPVAMLWTILLTAWMGINFQDRPARRMLIAAVFMMLAPLSYSFGTDTQLVFHMSGAAVFWAAGAIFLAAAGTPTWREALLSRFTILSGLATAGMLAGALIAPLRIHQTIFQQTEPVQVGADHATVLVDGETARYLRAFQASAASQGFAAGMPMIDLSEQGPGLAHALGAHILGTPWLVDGPFSKPTYYEAVLRAEPREQLRAAWVITSREFSLQDYAALLTRLGLDFPGGYTLVGQAELPAMPWRQQLWKPR